MNTLIFDKVKKLSEHFDIPPDCSKWNGQYRNIPKEGQTPDRLQASFETVTNSLSPTTCFASGLKSIYGIYVIGVELPHPAIYIGIAAGESKSPEGILKRIRKHRVKVTASHVGSNNLTVGGVNHTLGWRCIAKQRAEYFQTINELDTCKDLWFAVGRAYDNSGANLIDKMTLEVFESMLVCNHQDLYKKLSQFFWPNAVNVADCLTVRYRKLKHESILNNYKIQFDSY
jgi:hypothetical protein